MKKTQALLRDLLLLFKGLTCCMVLLTPLMMCCQV
ncbi:hypothetical protein M8C21_025250 [Ambrosia artemisiifolia]|uniref:Uncharacterized protein n=1 Tax=Ambrosia artemisiifolia TaxID=4212 RepID=A0AAD5BY81_AMBAR|nr:hypothetical protein M8C21_025250 [Ambrosia artemisiifolia]